MIKAREDGRLIDFLMKLGDGYKILRGNILVMNHKDWISLWLALQIRRFNQDKCRSQSRQNNNFPTEHITNNMFYYEHWHPSSFKDKRQAALVQHNENQEVKTRHDQQIDQQHSTTTFIAEQYQQIMQLIGNDKNDQIQGFKSATTSPSMNPLVLGSLKDGLYYLDAKDCLKICHQAKQVQNSFSSSVSKPNKFFNRTNYIKADGTIERFKEHLVSKGYNKKRGIDLEEPFSTMVKMTTIRCIIVVASHKGKLLDSDLQSLLENCLIKVFCNIRMIIHCSSRKTNDSITIVAVYVDDIIFTSNDAQEIAYTASGLTLTQRKFTQELLKEANITDFKTKDTPLPLNLKLTADKGELYTDPSYYSEEVSTDIEDLQRIRNKASTDVSNASTDNIHQRISASTDKDFN
ncbi:hypothetical protein AgCh_002418 [Apium graveolens]